MNELTQTQLVKTNFDSKTTFSFSIYLTNTKLCEHRQFINSTVVLNNSTFFKKVEKLFCAIKISNKSVIVALDFHY